MVIKHIYVRDLTQAATEKKGKKISLKPFSISLLQPTMVHLSVVTRHVSW
jgi:hypothetical protein